MFETEEVLQSGRSRLAGDCHLRARGTFSGSGPSYYAESEVTRDEFAALAVDYLREVTAYARRLTRNAADADDLVQDTYDRAFRHWSDLRELRACRAWLFRIARNIFTDQVRRGTARPELRLVNRSDALGPEPVVPAESVERLDAHQLEGALKRLPDDQREAVLLCDLWGFRYEEIAEIMSCPLGTVQSRIARGRAMLATLLAADSARGQGRGS
jgi:RNA polymerase sigma-70 factor, ECF subfamily